MSAPATLPAPPPAPEATGERLGYACMLGSSAGFAVMGVFVKVASATVPFYEVAFFRAFGGLLVAVVGMAIARVPFRPQQKLLLTWRGVLGWSSMMTYFLAVSWLPLPDAVLLNYTNPFFTALLAAAILGERLTARTLGCLAVAIAGVVLVVGPQGQVNGPGAAAALVSAFCAALAYVTVKQANATNTPTTIVVVFSLVGSVLCIPELLWRYVPPDPRTWGALAAAAVFGTGAQLLMTYGYRLARASTASILTLVTPLMAALLSLAAFGQPLAPGTLAGGSLILGAGVVLFLRAGR